MKRSSSLHGKYNSLAIQSKLSHFREKYNQSQQKFATKYSWHIQSDDKKSQCKTKEQGRGTPQTSRKSLGNKVQSKKHAIQRLSGSGILNPQLPQRHQTMIDQVLLKNLNYQASEMTGYAQLNAQLLNKKNKLKNLIQQLKQKIALQTRTLSLTNVNCGKLTNTIQKTQQRLRQKVDLSAQLQKNIEDTNIERHQTKRKLQHNTEYSNYNKKTIQKLTNQINDLQVSASNTYIHLMNKQNERLVTKEKLNLELKVMDICAIENQELISQKSYLKATLDKSVQDNKIQMAKWESRRSKISQKSVRKDNQSTDLSPQKGQTNN